MNHKGHQEHKEITCVDSLLCVLLVIFVILFFCAIPLAFLCASPRAQRKDLVRTILWLRPDGRAAIWLLFVVAAARRDVLLVSFVVRGVSSPSAKIF
jgi:hypothetical protein